MPFIYRGLEGEVLSDYVDVDMHSLDLATLRLKPINKIILKNEERLRSNNRILFLGNAGVGKTTFQRYAILLLLRKASGSLFTYEKQQLIPIYVPLKAIDNSSPYPVTRYIIESVTPFSGQRGARRLLNMASKGKLFLFLDGYDEIPFTGAGRNFVQEELGELFLGTRRYGRETQDVHDEVVDVLKENRMWLSSRREFFEQNPLGSLGSGRHPIVNHGFVALEIQGVGSNRIKLARVIFDKYRKQSSEYAQILSEEYFIYDIDYSNDSEMKRLSFNPLFLTMMCYIYAQKAIEEKTHEVDWARKFDDLILECIDLLLRDLDEYKARDLPLAHKAGLLNRRNAFTPEKRLFVEYFAAQLFFEAKSVFDLSYLKTKVKQYFREEGVDSSAASVILADLDEDTANRPNFALQLVFCGVFVTAGKRMADFLYDFPHRRFREVLASKYIATPERYILLLDRLYEKQFSEFLVVFFASQWFKDFAFQDQSAELIFSRVLQVPRSTNWRNITYRYLSLTPPGYTPDRHIKNFLREALIQAEPRFSVSLLVLQSFSPDEYFLEDVVKTFNRSIEDGNPYRLALTCELLYWYNKLLLRERISGELRSGTFASALAPILVQFTCLIDSRILLDHLDVICSDPERLLDLAFVLGSLSGRAVSLKEMLPKLFHGLKRRLKLSFFLVLAKHTPGSYEELRSIVRFDIDVALFRFLIAVDTRRYLQKLNEAQEATCFVFSQSAIQRLRQTIRQFKFPRVLRREIRKGEETRVLYAEIRDDLRKAILEQLDQFTTQIYIDPADIRNKLLRACSDVIRETKFQELKASPAVLEEIENFKQLRERIGRLIEAFILTATVRKSLVLDILEAIAHLSYTPAPLNEYFQEVREDGLRAWVVK
jgi:hypothetical protein